MNQVVDVRKKVLEENQRLAAELRQGFAAHGTLVANLISSPGSGKTTLLEATARRLMPRISCAVLVGDVATERDAERIRAAGMPAHQILTGGSCHLDARLVDRALRVSQLRMPDLLVIENVGNLICPTSYDLGEDFKVALLSVTEGEDKPFKYPGIFSKAELTVITKIDLLPHLSFDLQAAQAQIAALNPRGRQLLLSAQTGQGMDEWCKLLEERLHAKRLVAV
jgi:hydrogenase nickel incorporation protein HypB